MIFTMVAVFFLDAFFLLDDLCCPTNETVVVALVHYGQVLQALTLVGLLTLGYLWRQHYMLGPFYKIRLCGYIGLYLLDVVAMAYDWYNTPWYRIGRQDMARTIIFGADMVMAWQYTHGKLPESSARP